MMLNIAPGVAPVGGQLPLALAAQLREILPPNSHAMPLDEPADRPLLD